VAAIDGTVKVAEAGEMDMYRLSLDEDALLSVAGLLRLDRLTLRSGRTEFSPEADVQINRVLQHGGTLVLNGAFSANQLTVNKARLEMHDGPSPYLIAEQLELSSDSELRFLIRDDSWGSALDLAADWVPAFAGDLVLEFVPTANPKQLEGATLKLLNWGEGISPSSEFDRVILPARVEADLARLYASGEITIQSVREKPVTPGDFNGDDLLDVADLDDLIARILVNSEDAYYDVDDDNTVTPSDLESWIHDVKNTWLGDTNLDGEFTTGDLVLVLEAGKYETGEYASWSEGDWNGDGVFGAGDLVKALADGGYETGPRGDVAAVPEPASGFLSIVAISLFVVHVRRARRYRRRARLAFEMA
jgi:hypothetical protein